MSEALSQSQNTLYMPPMYFPNSNSDFKSLFGHIFLKKKRGGGGGGKKTCRSRLIFIYFLKNMEDTETKDENIGFDGYIGIWILRIYRIYRRYIGGYFYMNIDISEIKLL